MEPVNTLIHAYRQAPWRVQRQWISLTLILVLGFAMIAALYLMITSQAAIVGREIQNLREETIATRQKNADLQTELARVTSKDEMDRRAIALGYRPVESGELEYLFVPGYVAPKGVILATSMKLKPSTPSTPPEYTQSLLEWLDDNLQMPRGGGR